MVDGGQRWIGRHCRLRPFRPEDARSTFVWRQDQQTRDALLGYRGAITQESEDRWMAAIIAGEPDGVSLAVCTPQDDAIRGYVRLMQIDPVSRHAAFGIVIGAGPDRGRGLGTEATALAVRHAFDGLGLCRVHLRVLAENEPAIRVYRRLGFVEEGRLRRHEFRSGRLQDLILMGLLADERAAVDAALA